MLGCASWLLGTVFYSFSGPRDKLDIVKWLAMGVPVGFVVLIILGASIYALYAICCAKDKLQHRQCVSLEACFVLFICVFFAAFEKGAK